MSDDGYMRPGRRRLPWSPWWLLSLIGLAWIVLLLFLPVTSGQVDCGFLLSGAGTPFERGLDFCRAALADRWLSIVTVAVLALTALAVGQYDRGAVAPSTSVRVVVPILGLTVGLLLWPVDTPRGSHCGSVLLTGVDEVAERIATDQDREFARCVAVRSNRIGWALLGGAAALVVLSVRAGPRRED